MRCFLLALCVGLGTLLAAEAAAPAQDWNVKRDPFDKTLVARYKRMLAKNPGDQRALSSLTRLYMRYRSVGLLIKEYERELENKPDQVSARIVLGHLHAEAGQTDEAIAHYRRAAQVAPKNLGVLTALGELYKARGDLDEAMGTMRQALAAASTKKDKQAVLRGLTEVALAKDDISAAKKFFDQAIALDPKNNQIRIDLGDALTRYERHEDAVKAYREAEKGLKSDPALRVDVISRIGSALEKAGDDEAAVREYRRAMSLTKRGYYLRKELTARIVDIYRRRQDLGSLISEYEKQWPARRRDHFEWDVLARLYEEVGNQDKAIDAFKAAIAKAPHELDTQRRLITLLENSGREAEALSRYEAVIRVAPGEPRFQLELAQRYWKAGEEKKALSLAARIERQFSSDPGVFSTLADLYAQWGAEDKALDAYERLARIEPDDSQHLINLGEQYFQRNNKKKAMQVWRKIIRVKSAENYARLGRVLSDHDLLSDALQLYGKAIKLDAKNPDFYRGRAQVYERQRRWQDAVSDWEKTLDLTPDKAVNKSSIAEARRRVVHLLSRAGSSVLGDRISKWEKQFRADPPQIAAGYFLVEAYLRGGKYASARKTLTRLLKLRPSDLDAKHQLVKVYRSEQKYDEAIALLLELAKITPAREREYYNQIAEIKTILHQDDEAIRYVQKALEKSPNDPVAHERLGERYRAMQKYDQAIRAYEKTIELNPRAFNAYFELARLYLNKEKLKEASELYRQVLRQASDEETLHRAGREAIELEELLGTLGELEKTLSPLAITFGHKPVFRRILVDLYGRYVPALVARAHRGDDTASGELERLGKRGLKPLLEALADDKDVSQQRIAVSVLGYLGNRGAAAPLVKLATRPMDQSARQRAALGTMMPTLGWDVRVEALVAAGRLGDPRTIPDLLKLSSHEEVAVREAAVFALGVTGDSKAVRPLIAALSDARGSVQTLACLGLARVRDNTAHKAVLEAVRDERKSDATRAACAHTLGLSGRTDSVPVLIETLEHGNESAQRLAAWALGALGDKRALGPLLGAYFGKREDVRTSIAWALARLSGGKAAPIQVSPIATFPIRSGKFDETLAIESLAEPLPDRQPVARIIVGNEREIEAGIRTALGRHRDLVLRVLADLDGRRGGIALGPLTRGAGAEPPARRKAIEKGLTQIGRALADDLARLCESPDSEIRRTALSVLAKVGAEPARPAIREALEAEDLAVRAAAMRAAATYARLHGNGDALSARVAAHLRARAWQERIAAARALGDFGSDAGSEPLVKALSGDPKGFVREAAAEALGRARSAAAVPALARAADPAIERVIAVRVAAVRSMVAIGGPKAKAALEKAASDDSARVRRAARDGARPRSN